MIIKTVSVDVTPEEMAALFCDMTDESQALFFNEVGKLSKTWEQPFAAQAHSIVNNYKLDGNGMMVLAKLADEFNATIR